MNNFGRLGPVLLVAGALALSVSMTACSSSGNNSGTGGATGTGGAAAGGATGAGGAASGMGGVIAQDAGTDVPATITDGGTDTGPTTDPHQVHLDIINATTTTGTPVSRPAPTISYSSCRI